MRVRHAFWAVGRKFYANPDEQKIAEWDQIFPPTEHPLVWHQKCGRTSMLIGSTVDEIVGMPAEEGAALITELTEFATEDCFTYRHEWKKGDVVIFNNPALLHRSFPYDKGAGRLMHRTTIAGTEPIE